MRWKRLSPKIPRSTQLLTDGGIDKPVGARILYRSNYARLGFRKFFAFYKTRVISLGALGGYPKHAELPYHKRGVFN